MPFIEVKNFKDALLQEMKALQWDNYGEGPAPEPSSQLEMEYYIKYKYFKEIENSTLVGPVLLPTSTCQTWFGRMFTALGGETNQLSYLEGQWRPIHELVNWSGTEKLLGELVNDGIISVNNLFKYNLNEGWQQASESKIGIYELGTGVGKYSSELTGDEAKFRLMTSGVVPVTQVSTPATEDFVKTMTESVLKPYVDSNGKEHVSKIIPFRQIPNDAEEDHWTGAADTNNDYIYRGENPPRVKVTNRDYMMYIKFKCEDNGITFYRYIPIFPFITLEYTSSCVPRYGYSEYNMGYASSQFPPFSYQPFNMYLADIKLFKDKYSLPPILFNGMQQIRQVQCYPATSYNYPTVFVPENDILQFMFLTGVRFVINDSQDGELTPYYDLTNGLNTYSTDAEVGGETDSNSGDIDWDAFDDTKYIVPAPIISNGKHPVPSSILEPGFYGGVYIPTWRYIQKITDDTTSNQNAVDNLNDYISKLTSLGKNDALVESFIHYSEFINSRGYDSNGNSYDNRWKMGVKEVDVERPKFIAGYDGKEGYYPVNNKVLTYPFVSFEMNGYGQRNEIKFENWGGSTPTFCLAAKFQPGACVMMIPKNYEGVLYNFDASVTAQPLPIMSYTRDDFKNEYNAGMSLRAQSMAAAEQQMGLNFISAGVSAITSGASTALMGEAANAKGKTTNTGLIGGAINSLVQMGGATLGYHQQKKAFEAELQDVERRPLSVVNQNACPSMPALMGNYVTPFCVWKSVRKEFAIKIDEYFSRYGYRVNKYKQPKIKTRPLFNYMQLGDARVTGKIPNADLSVIKQVLEKGITFWHNKDVIGDYSRTIHEQNAGKKGKPVYLYPTYENV